MNRLCPSCGGVGKIAMPMPSGTSMNYYDPVSGSSWPLTHCNSCGGSGWVWMDTVAPCKCVDPAKAPVIPTLLPPGFKTTVTTSVFSEVIIYPVKND